LSFANQNLSRYEFESEALNVSNYQKRALSLMIMHLIIRNFSEGARPVSAETIAADLKLPVRLVRDILQDLSNVELVSVIQRNEHAERFFQPALDINKLTVSFILNRLYKKGTANQITVRSKEYIKVTMMLDKFEKIISKSDMNILVRDL
jgi:membrane protein